MVRRRQILLATAAAGAAGTAGCVSDDPSDERADNNDEDTPPDLKPTGDGGYRVDITARSDRSASIDDVSHRPSWIDPIREISYAGDPEVVWGYDSLEADDSSSEIAVDPVIDTTDDAEHVFLAPVYDADAGNWNIHAYVDEAYYEARDTHRFWIGRPLAELREDPVRGYEAAFTEHHDGVYRATVEYDETPEDTDPNLLSQVWLTNWPVDRTAEPSEPMLGAAVAVTRVGPPPTNPDYDEVDEDDPAPMVDLSFEYDPDAKTVTIVHEGGPAFRGEHVQVGFEGGLTEEQFSGEVTAGDSLTVGVPSANPGEYLAVTWRGPEQEHTIVLDRFQIPE
ncbi:hypothetical protein HYG81_16365 [Natrinema zhouii]|uniref:Uncharacterized protein n=1 Tax=Natrinema zhouii TaxID=1710539 RepID=A0A7D6CP37_9EURY|nr:hypothetical protein [Natrinema zhouii]QLK25636.1 hypothetical protein HYG81_16365 [Natrinema zhouii]